MPTYVLLSTLTPEGRQTLHKDPDRLEEVNQEIADFGCNILAQYAGNAAEVRTFATRGFNEESRASFLKDPIFFREVVTLLERYLSRPKQTAEQAT
jgi:1-deoxy-D-xylulose 5-phosphate reductoisomerase